MTKVRLCMVTFGVIVGIVGILHGIAELLQGSEVVASRSVEALPQGWPNEEFNSMTEGSPVFTVLTDLPAHDVAQAIDRFLTGRAGDGRFAPTPAQIAIEARSLFAARVSPAFAAAAQRLLAIREIEAAEWERTQKRVSPDRMAELRSLLTEGVKA